MCVCACESVCVRVCVCDVCMCWRRKKINISNEANMAIVLIS